MLRIALALLIYGIAISGVASVVIAVVREFRGGSLESQFKKIFQSSHGEIYLIDFAVKTEVSSKRAETFLTKKVDQLGGIDTFSASGSRVFLFGDAAANFIGENK